MPDRHRCAGSGVPQVKGRFIKIETQKIIEYAARKENGGRGKP